MQIISEITEFYEKATAGESQASFFYCSASEFVELYVGMGAKRVRELFNKVTIELIKVKKKKRRDCINQQLSSLMKLME